jgi:hypothetical protein
MGASLGGIYIRAYQRRYPEEVVGLDPDDPTATRAAEEAEAFT